MSFSDILGFQSLKIFSNHGGAASDRRIGHVDYWGGGIGGSDTDITVPLSCYENVSLMFIK